MVLAVLRHPAFRGIFSSRLVFLAQSVPRNDEILSRQANRWLGVTTIRPSDEIDADPQPKPKRYTRNTPELTELLKDLYDDNDGIKGFRESRIIYDVDEERAIAESMLPSGGELQEEPKEKFVPSKYSRHGLEPGVKGVFDVDDLVLILRKENCFDICVLKVPEELGYVDELVIVTCKSKRHLGAVATLLRKLFKLRRRNRSTGIPDIEGLKAKSDWLAIDMGNVALHLFTQQDREKYDLESLWSLGNKLDVFSMGKDSLEELLETHPLLADLSPQQTC